MTRTGRKKRAILTKREELMRIGNSTEIDRQFRHETGPTEIIWGFDKSIKK